MSARKRVMVCGEASYLATGFGTYALELLKRLHASGKYELMEYASYSEIGDVRAEGLPWRHKSAMYHPDSEEERGIYHSNPFNQFGEWKFEEACVEFRPDVVLDYRDHWMMGYQLRSPFRPYYKLAWMPTVDAEPQDEAWLADYMEADAVFTYSDWALDLLRRQSRGRINLLCSAPPGADLETYEVKQDRRAHRKAMGIDPDILLVGTVMRNQRRKLYPELLEAFAKFLSEAPAELAKKTYLYLHTAWPDVGWDIPRLIRENKLSSKTLFTYFCKSCGMAFPSFFQDARTVCRACGKATAVFPNTKLGVSRKVLCEVFGLFDVYVQYANSEGFGMPQVEAAACGIPVMATDYSAMSDVVRKIGGMPIRPLCMVREPETHCKRAIPDQADFIDKLTRFLLLPEAVRARRGRIARQGVETHYTWDQTARRWMDYLDSVETYPHERTWLSPPRIHQPSQDVPQGLSNEDFVRWGMVQVAGRPELVSSFAALRLVRDLNWAGTLDAGMGGGYFNDLSALGLQQKMQPFDRQKAYEVMADIAAKRNRWEGIRAERCRQ